MAPRDQLPGSQTLAHQSPLGRVMDLVHDPDV